MAAALWLGAGLATPPTREGRAAAVVAASPARVVAVILDVARQPEWRADVAGVALTDGGWRETTRRGETIAFRWVETGPDRLALAFAGKGYAGEWSAEITAASEGAHVALVERVTTPNPLLRPLAWLAFDHGAFSRRYLDALGERVEAAS